MNILRYLAAAAVLPASGVFAGGNITYFHDGIPLEGYFETVENPMGTVVVVHDWDGLTDYEMDRVNMLASMGYNAFALDLYGKDVRPTNASGAKAESAKLYEDRYLMLRRTLAGIEQARTLGDNRIVVIGYCFGGASVLDLLRSGDADLYGVVGYATFHGDLSSPEETIYFPDSGPVFIAHGGADMAIPAQEVTDLTNALEDVGINYEATIYAGAPHAFTVFGSRNYDQTADARSWHAFSEFLQDAL